MITDRDIAGMFNAELGWRHRTLLVGGGNAPVYVPARGRAPAMIRYTRDYARSALHELAHWALAGPRRRRLEDYGYWYRPPPRTERDQSAFFAAELRVQALERLFCSACGLDFQVSADNVDADCRVFEAQVRSAAAALRDGPMPRRAQQLLARLRALRG